MNGPKRTMLFMALWAVFTVVTSILVCFRKADSAIWFYVMSLFCLLRAEMADRDD